MFNTNKQKILIKFIESEPKEWYALELSRELNISVGSANTLLKELEREGYLESQTVGKTILYSAKSDNSVLNQFKKLINIEKASHDLKELQKLSKKIVLFGSRAFGKELPESDLDILVVTEEPAGARRILAKREFSKYKPIILTPIEYIGLKRKNLILYNEIEKGQVVFSSERI